MSWIFGIYSTHEIGEDERRKLCNGCEDKIVGRIENRNFFAALGEIPAICHHSETALISGTALRDYLPVSIEDWQRFFANPDGHPDFDGQYCGLHFSDGRLTIFNDHFNNRPFYLYPTKDAVVFSTDWPRLKPFMQNPKLDMDAIAGLWLTNGQFHYRCFIKDLIRSHPASVFTITPDLRVRHRASRWIGIDQPAENIDHEAALDKTISWFVQHHKVSLGMSGGTDSRLMLAFMMQHRENPWRMHTFGERDNPEIVVAERIARDLGLDLIVVEPHPRDPDTILERAKKIAAHTEMTYSIRAYRMIDNLKTATEGNRIILDGDYGCFIRDYFLNGIQLRLKWTPPAQRFDKLFELLRHPRTNFFPESLFRRMNEVVREDFYNLPATLPEWNGNDYTALIALLHAYYRYPNLVRNWNLNLEHAMLISPMGQASMIRDLLRMPVRKRANCRISYPILKKLAPSLMKYPLVRYGTTVPFAVYRNYLASGMIAKYKRQRGLCYRSDRSAVQLEAMKPIVHDLASSEAVRNCEYYDYNKIRSLVNGYYRAPNDALGNALFEWLGFEFYRQSVED